jgi:hypothetical protein
MKRLLRLSLIIHFLLGGFENVKANIIPGMWRNGADVLFAHKP